MSQKQKRLSLAGTAVLVAVLVGIGIAAAVGSGGSSARSSIGRSAIERVHARNVQLQTYLVMLMRRHGGHVASTANMGSESGGEVATESTAPSAQSSACDPNYSGDCLDPNASDYDCEGGSGDGPDYTGPVTVVGSDHYDLDSDGDGNACE